MSVLWLISTKYIIHQSEPPLSVNVKKNLFLYIDPTEFVFSYDLEE
jgi:hypothetical protein